eukprot:COSAG06_NODE_41841_length_387_cov_0.840278_1_plen_35_part_01
MRRLYTQLEQQCTEHEALVMQTVSNQGQLENGLRL